MKGIIGHHDLFVPDGDTSDSATFMDSGQVSKGHQVECYIDPITLLASSSHDSMQKHGTPLPVSSISTLQDDRVTISSRQCENVPQPFPSRTTSLDQESELPIVPSWLSDISFIDDPSMELGFTPSWPSDIDFIDDPSMDLGFTPLWPSDIDFINRPSMSCIDTPDSGYHSLSTTPQGHSPMLAVDDSTPSTVNTQLPVCSIEETTDEIIATSLDEKDPQEDPSFDEAEIDSRQREPTPWPESWYDGGMELGLPAFAASIMGECFNKPVPGIPTSETQPNSPEAHEPAPEIDGNDRQEQGSGQGSDDTVIHLAFQLESPAPNSQTKRARSSRDGNSQDDEEAPDPKRPATMPPPPDYANQGPLYACPYQKRYPMESPFCGMPHGARRVYGWDSVSRVKQHLLESHGRDHHCSNCWKAYKKVSDAGDCHRKRNCLKRQSPPKLWLSETEASRLRAEKFDSKTADSWYRVFGILFPDKQEHGPEGYRAKYTPYYSRVEYPLPAHFSNFYNGKSPIPSLSPNSIWTPSSNSTNSTVLTPSDPGGTMTTYNGGDTHEESLLSALLMGYEGVGELLHGAPAVDGASDHHTAGDDANIATDHRHIDSQFEMLISNPGHEPLDGYSNGPTTRFAVANNPAAPEQQPEPCRSCSSSSIRRCSPCKLKKRIAHLRADNEGLRTVLARIRQTVELHDETIQSIDEKNIVPDEIMAKLEGYQERLRGCLALVR